MKRTELTGREQRFVTEYPIDYNGTRAAVAAGYSQKGASAIACALLKKPHIQKALKKSHQEVMKRTGLTKERILYELECLAFRNIKKFFDEDGFLLEKGQINQLPDEVCACIDGWEQESWWEGKGEDAVRHQKIKVKLVGKGPMVELVLKHLGLLIEKKDVSGTVKLDIDWDQLRGRPATTRADMVQAKIDNPTYQQTLETTATKKT